MNSTDVLIIGSGIGGLSCGALLARYGLKVTICESHTIAGGAAHGFERQGFKFDSGPSLYSGMSYSPSANPLRQVLDAVEEDLTWINYDRWGCLLPEGEFNAAVGAEQFQEILRKFAGPTAIQEWQQLQTIMEPLAKAVIALPTAAFRFDPGTIFSVGRFLPALLPQIGKLPQLTGPFDQVIKGVITDPFIYNWLNLLCFLLSGLPINGTSTAEVAFMFADWYRPGVVLDYPQGGSAALVAALVRGLQKYGGELRLGAHVQQILIQQGRAVGVKLKNNEEITARLGVISNASIWDTLNLLPPDQTPKGFRQSRQATPPCDSFLHLHLGIDAQDLSKELECHYIIAKDWQITAPQNLVAVSIPSVLDPSLAPPGHHSIHVYTPATEPYEIWAGMDRQSPAYEQQKQTRLAPIWEALERIIPELRARCRVILEGTPLTHERFLRRYRGSYGPALRAGKEFFPGPTTPIPGLYCCGDSTFPGIGLPAVAASGMMTANTLAPLDKHLELLTRLGL